ncbi:hypothetical protein N7G274_006795 [Stereocaulon virgatum]|uniref:Uncharacterized protein n=1 Tax=Stereocaulon virgatum TaxID=373712 RepID=A0ABR4A7I1_9LECA
MPEADKPTFTNVASKHTRSTKNNKPKIPAPLYLPTSTAPPSSCPKSPRPITSQYQRRCISSMTTSSITLLTNVYSCKHSSLPAPIIDHYQSPSTQPICDRSILRNIPTLLSSSSRIISPVVWVHILSHRWRK